MDLNLIIVVVVVEVIPKEITRGLNLVVFVPGQFRLYYGVHCSVFGAGTIPILIFLYT